MSADRPPTRLAELDAGATRELLSARVVSCADVVEAFLSALGGDELNAWAAVDPGLLRQRAAALDAMGDATRRTLALYGLPFGVKDTFDTFDLPTAYGSPIYATHRPLCDSATVQRLRAAGAIVAGKTKCSEFAWMFAPDTRNPVDPARTPGGSSSGSAAAVGARTVAMATGTQTAGSINRPASYCAVLGYKPTAGAFPRRGVKPLSATLDTVGLFARSVKDLRMFATVLVAPSPVDPTRRTSQPIGFDDAERGVPHIGVMPADRMPGLEPEARAALEAVAVTAERLGARVSAVELPSRFAELTRAQTTIQLMESAIALGPEIRSSSELLSDDIRDALRKGAAISLDEYLDARRTAGEVGARVVDCLRQFDCILTASASGVPPVGLDFTGDPEFCRAWTLIGVPTISVPLAWTGGGLPLGLQLVAPPWRDGRLLSCAAWLLDRLGSGLEVHV